MEEVRIEKNPNEIRIYLSGRIDSNNADEIKNAILPEIGSDPAVPVVVDASELKYISSAGLRVFLQIRKAHPDMKIINTSVAIYEILEITGFTEMIDVSKKYRSVSIDNCKVIGRGAAGTIYRLNKECIVKVNHDPDSLDDIRRERELAKSALVLGIPTAIAFEIVRVGDGYGAIYELLNARTIADILRDEPDKIDWCAEEYVSLLRLIHSTEVPPGKLPVMKDKVIDWGMFMKNHLPAETGDKLLSLIEAVPDNNHMIHGDYHTKNIMVTGEEVLLIDMDTVATGDPVFEFASIFNAFIGFSEPGISNSVKDFQGFPPEIAREFWHIVLAKYAETDDPAVLQSMEDKARIIGYTRLIRRSIRRDGLETENGRKEIDFWKERLIKLVDSTDSLSFC